VSQRQDSRVFGKRPKHSHTIIFASGETIRHITVRPWMAGLLMSVLGVMAIGYLAATSYLVLRDDLIGASMARQARMQHAYEDRIAALRSQVDRVTSRQLLDQQLMEEKVAELIARQNALSNRHGKLGPLLDRAGAAAGQVPVPTVKPKEQASLPPFRQNGASCSARRPAHDRLRSGGKASQSAGICARIQISGAGIRRRTCGSDLLQRHPLAQVNRA
jgi:hypothetical protein